MKTFDWIVVGAGITGAALSYELVKQGFSVLLVDASTAPLSATRLSYGGIAYWSGTTDLTRQLCDEGREMHRSLSQELDGDTQFREIDLLLTIAAERDPSAIANNYKNFATPPQLLTVPEACQLEPLLNPANLSGALTVKHGHIEAELTAQSYCQAFQRLGGTLQIAQVTGLQRQGVDTITGILTSEGEFQAANVAVCTGGITRHFLKAAGIPVRQYFTHAELIEIPPVELRMNTLVMPAETERFALEAQATRPEVEDLWDVPGNEPTSPILDAGVVQFLDGRIRIGQISRVLSDPNAAIDAAQSERELRSQVGQVLPAIAQLPGTWQRCLVAFSRDRLPLVGELMQGLHLFSGFSNPLAIVPPLARRFAKAASGQPDELLRSLSPQRP